MSETQHETRVPPADGTWSGGVNTNRLDANAPAGLPVHCCTVAYCGVCMSAHLGDQSPEEKKRSKQAALEACLELHSTYSTACTSFVSARA